MNYIFKINLIEIYVEELCAEKIVKVYNKDFTNLRTRSTLLVLDSTYEWLAWALDT